jgi:hypothetical protein
VEEAQAAFNRAEEVLDKGKPFGSDQVSINYDDLNLIIAVYSTTRDIAEVTTALARKQRSELALTNLALDIEGHVLLETVEHRDNYKSALRQLNEVHKPIGTTRQFCVACNTPWPCNSAKILQLVSVE